MFKVCLAILGITSLMLFYSTGLGDQVFYATKIIGITLAFGAVGLWALWARGKDLS